MLFNRNQTHTSYITLDTKKCNACWKCINSCSGQVIRKIDIFHHTHTVFSDPDACSGCLTCLEVCESNAYTQIAGENKSKGNKRDVHFNFLINSLLLVTAFIMVYSGLILQFGFHMGGPQETGHTDRHYEQIREIDKETIVSGFNYLAWSAIHKVIIVVFSLLMVYHIYNHWNWYKTILSKHLIRKNRQVLLLSLIFLFTALTGLVPWFIDLSGGRVIFRIMFIEIHDKLTLIMIILMVLHFIRRYKWYSRAYKKL